MKRLGELYKSILKFFKIVVEKVFEILLRLLENPKEN